jgi:hypothetical protein
VNHPDGHLVGCREPGNDPAFCNLLPEFELALSLLVRFNQIRWERVILRRHEDKTRLLAEDGCVELQFCERRSSWAPGAIERTGNAHEEVALSDLGATEILRRFIYRSEVLHANTMVAMQAYNGAESSLSALLQVFARRTEEDGQHLVARAPGARLPAILKWSLNRLNGRRSAVQPRNSQACRRKSLKCMHRSWGTRAGPLETRNPPDARLCATPGTCSNSRTDHAWKFQQTAHLLYAGKVSRD